MVGSSGEVLSKDDGGGPKDVSKLPSVHHRTKMCYNFMKGCNKSKGCNFAHHTQDELRQPREVFIEHLAPASVAGYIAPPTAVTYAAPAPVVENVAPTTIETCAAPAPVPENIAPTTAVTYAAPAPVVVYVAPTTMGSYAAPAPVDEYVAPDDRCDLRSTCSRG